ncbi:hypothetical protein EFN35_04270, partial [Pediococcus parvulus]|nr:hypothetical protein [Pediococcus parvulus]
MYKNILLLFKITFLKFFLRKLQEQVSHPAGEVAGKSEYLLKVKIMATHYMLYEYVLLQFEKLLLGFDTSRYVAVIG